MQFGTLGIFLNCVTGYLLDILYLIVLLMTILYLQTDEESIDTMHKLNGKPIPGTFPVVRFRLNTASREARANLQEREFSVWVGDLSPEVDDYSLYRVFASKYSSIKTAKGTVSSIRTVIIIPKPFICHNHCARLFT